jgi:hypothetical protein
VAFVDGGAPTTVASPGQDLTWSPDGTRIAFRSGGHAADGEMDPPGLATVGVDGSDLRQIEELSPLTGRELRPHVVTGRVLRRGAAERP